MSDSEHTERSLVVPTILRGFQDYLPGDMIRRNMVIETVRGVYEKYGFVPVDTPILEYLVTLIGTGGEAINKELFRFDSPENEPIAMRFDLTVPFSRIIAQYPDKITLPFRRYHIGPVFRVDKPSPGRFRQFTQLDIDVAGSDDVAVDAEMVAVMCEVLTALGLRNEGDGQCSEYVVRVNNRKLMDALLEGCGIAGDHVRKHVLRVVDKLQKAGLDNVQKELGTGRVDESGDPIKGVGLEPATVDRLMSFIAAKADSRAAMIDVLEDLLPECEATVTALQEMRDMEAALRSLKINENEVVFDPTLARGLDYYTGPVFEAFLPQAPEFGSVMGGGRYDHLVERFLDTRIPATGVSIGLDRLIAALDATGRMETKHTATRVIVLGMKGIPMPDLLSVATELRAGSIPAEVYMGAPGPSMKRQLSYANSKDIPIAVIIGQNELDANQVSVKDLAAGKQGRADLHDHAEYKKAGRSAQVTVDRCKLVETVQGILA